MKKLELFKPIQYLKGNNPVLFTELGTPIMSSYGQERGFRPFVIFYSEEENSYYYIKSRDALRKTVSKKYGPYKKQWKGEVLIKAAEQGLFSKDSYVDCSQFFRIDADLLESLVDFDNSEYKNTNSLSRETISEIIEEINKCCSENPPYLSIVQVYKTGRDLKSFSLYLCDKKVEMLDEKSDWEMWNDSLVDLLSASYSGTVGPKYASAIDFVKNYQSYVYRPWLSVKDGKEEKFLDFLNGDIEPVLE